MESWVCVCVHVCECACMFMSGSCPNVFISSLFGHMIRRPDFAMSERCASILASGQGVIHKHLSNSHGWWAGSAPHPQRHHNLWAHMHAVRDHLWNCSTFECVWRKMTSEDEKLLRILSLLSQLVCAVVLCVLASLSVGLRACELQSKTSVWQAWPVWQL